MLTNVLLAVKDTLWELIPQKIVNIIIAAYFNRKKLKKQDWMLLNTAVAGKCNLNCVGCSGFAPIARDELLAPEVFESDCKRLAELTDGSFGGAVIPEWHLLGGEPLLNPMLSEIISIARKYFPQTKLKILTNGTLLLRQNEDFWERLRANKVGIIISHYPIKLDIKSIRKKVKEYKLKLRYYRGTLPWYKMEFDLAGGYNAEAQFRKCPTALQCVTLRNGKIATCAYIHDIAHFNDYFKKTLEVMETDVIDIYKAKSMDEILEFIGKPAGFCRYCSLKFTPLKWGTSEKDISEWT
jgi:hypothetical protein